MLILLSPAKTLDLTTPSPTKKFTLPDFLPDAAALITQLRTLSEPKIAQLMDLSEALTQLNANRYAAWTPDFTPQNAKQAVFSFAGDVYDVFLKIALRIEISRVCFFPAICTPTIQSQQVVLL